MSLLNDFYNGYINLYEPNYTLRSKLIHRYKCLVFSFFIFIPLLYTHPYSAVTVTGYPGPAPGEGGGMHGVA